LIAISIRQHSLLVRLEKLLDNQLLTNERLIQRIALMLLALCFAAFLAVIGVYQFRASSPYMQDVLAIKGDSVQGHAIFLMNCAGCHGTAAAGRVGPSLREISNRKSKVSMIHQVISGQTPPMPQFQPSPQEMADLLSYLESL
jgi:mono/diheme cytochrome c family protein